VRTEIGEWSYCSSFNVRTELGNGFIVGLELLGM
jgi:hypothetical protein